MRILIEKALAGLLVILFSATVLTVVWQVIGRYLLAAPSSATEEIARFLLIWLGMLSMTYAFAKRMHVGVDLISGHLSPTLRKSVSRAIWFGCAFFAGAVMVYGGGLLVQVTATLGQTSASLGLPMWMVYMIMPACGVIIAFLALAFLFEGSPGDSRDDTGDAA